MCHLFHETYECCGTKKDRWDCTDCPDREFLLGQLCPKFNTIHRVIKDKCCSKECCLRAYRSSTAFTNLESIEERLGLQQGEGIEQQQIKRSRSIRRSLSLKKKSERPHSGGYDRSDYHAWREARAAADNELAKHRICKPDC